MREFPQPIKGHNVDNVASPMRGFSNLLLRCGVILRALLFLAIFVWANVVLGDDVATYQVVDDAIPKSLTGRPGDSNNGRTLAAGRRANCLGCHRMPIPEQPFHGTAGPNLAGVGKKYTAGELRLRLVDPTKINPDTLMPAFHRTVGLHRVAPRFHGKPILTAAEIEDVVAYLLTLKGE